MRLYKPDSWDLNVNMACEQNPMRISTSGISDNNGLNWELKEDWWF